MKIEVNISQRYIDLDGHDADNCPIYHAIKEQYPEVEIWGVFSEVITCMEDKNVLLPPSAIEWIKKYDKWHPVTPFAFEMEIDE